MADFTPLWKTLVAVLTSACPLGSHCPGDKDSSAAATGTQPAADCYPTCTMAEFISMSQVGQGSSFWSLPRK
jgi:hypothetical protein